MTYKLGDTRIVQINGKDVTGVYEQHADNNTGDVQDFLVLDMEINGKKPKLKLDNDGNPVMKNKDKQVQTEQETKVQQAVSEAVDSRTPDTPMGLGYKGEDGSIDLKADSVIENAVKDRRTQREKNKKRTVGKEKAIRQMKEDIDIGDKALTRDSGKKSKVTILVVYIVLIFAIVATSIYTLNQQQAEIEIIRLKDAMLTGELLTEEHIESFKMLKETYDDLGRVTLKDDNGNSNVQQVIYKWSEKDQVLGKYMSSYTQAGQYITKKHITDIKIVRNPWLASVKEGQEIFTQKFDTSKGIDTRLLLPGTQFQFVY